MNHRVANAIRTIGQFYFMSETARMEKRKAFPARKLRIPLLVSLQALGFPTRSIKDRAEASDFARIAAHLHVTFGLFALKSLYFSGRISDATGLSSTEAQIRNIRLLSR